VIGGWLFAAAAPAIVDSMIRTFLDARSRNASQGRALDPVNRWVVLIPAREEGESLRPTLQSVYAAALKVSEAAAGDDAPHVVVILDGADPAGEAVANEFGAEVRLKEPAGPTKGAALVWASADLPRAADAVLILDVGSRVEEEFFEKFLWKRGSDAMQTLIAGRGAGAGDAAAASERVAQIAEDGGREALGWAVRLRGTGTAYRPEVFREIAPQLRTQVEDTEASLLLAAAGRVITMSEARVFDEKPDDVRQAAVQRGRWLAGKVQVIARHPDALARLALRNPAEGVAFAAELLSRPLALSAVLRCVAAAALLSGGRGGWRTAMAGVALGTVALDVALHVRHGATPKSAAKMLGAWLGGAALAPRAVARWMRARRP
jgi:hypothetical protein